MALALKDRVKETTIVVGTGTATLLGSSIGFQPFSVVGNGNTTYYCISDQFGSNWEVGIGTYSSSGNTLARTTVLASSNGGALVVFTAGVKDVFVTYPAEKGVWLDASGNAIGLGTPAAFVGTNITGTASGLTAGNVTTNANLTGAVTSTGNATSLGSFTSLQLATALTDETGSGSAVFATSPTLANPTYTGTLTGSTGILNIGSGQVYKDASGNVGIGTSSPVTKLDVYGAQVLNRGVIQALDSTAQAAGTGAGLVLGGFYTSTQTSAGVQIKASKTNGTSGDYGFDMSFLTLQNSTSNLTERMRIDSSGNVGIGTSSPASKLDVVGRLRVEGLVSDTSSVIEYKNYAGNLAYNFLDSSQNFIWNIASAERMRIDASGNVGIGCTPSSLLSIQNYNPAGLGPELILNNSGNSVSDSMAVTFASGAIGSGARGQIKVTVDNNPYYGIMTFSRGNSNATLVESMRIDSSGNLLVGTTTNNSRTPRLALNGNSVTWSVGPSASNSTFVVYNASEVGVYMGSGSSSWSSSSDERIKTKLTPFENPVQKICSLRAGTGRYLTDDESVSRSFLIAQDVQAVLPEAVNVQDDEQGTLGLAYTEVIPLLVASIKELKAIIDTQQEQINSLLGK